jgi:hypothetical protein
MEEDWWRKRRRAREKVRKAASAAKNGRGAIVYGWVYG